MRRILNLDVILMLIVAALTMSIVPSLAQTPVTAAAQQLAAFPKPASLIRGVDTYCGPYFLRSAVSGKDRLGFFAGPPGNEPTPLFADVRVVRDDRIAVPTARPLDGDWSMASEWEITMSQGAHDQASACLPSFSQ